MPDTTMTTTSADVLDIVELRPGFAPTRAHAGDAGLDLRADLGTDQSVTVPARGAATVSCGIAVAVPAGHVGLVFSRSGHGFKHDVRLANAVGVIDHGYTGEVKVRISNDADTAFTAQDGDRIAQLVIVPIRTPSVRIVDQLDETARGAGGFGSTGTHHTETAQ